jgi:hypothetical protein
LERTAKEQVLRLGKAREVTNTPEQIKAARRLLGWSCIDLALNLPVGLTRIRKIETKRRGPHDDAVLLSLQADLEAAGVTFVEEKRRRCWSEVEERSRTGSYSGR